MTQADYQDQEQLDAAPSMVEQLMEGDEKCQLDFEQYADDLGMDLSTDFFNQRGHANKYLNEDTRLAFDIWCHAIASRGA